MKKNPKLTAKQIHEGLTKQGVNVSLATVNTVNYSKPKNKQTSRKRVERQQFTHLQSASNACFRSKGWSIRWVRIIRRRKRWSCWIGCLELDRLPSEILGHQGHPRLSFCSNRFVFMVYADRSSLRPKIVERLMSYMNDFTADIEDKSRPTAFVQNPKPLSK
jgi:hypothetical protein